jgi:phospholipase C
MVRRTAMVSALALCALALSAGLSLAAATAFKHIVIVVQENRTPDSLFYELCSPPFGGPSSCSATPAPGQYDIKTSNWLDKTAPGGVGQPTAMSLGVSFDILHANSAFVAMCDRNPVTGTCAMDGAANEPCQLGVCPPHAAIEYVSNSTGILTPYLTLATQYGWANYMFQTNQGPSYPAHQYLFGGTSAPSAGDDAMGIFVANNGGRMQNQGCMSEIQESAVLIEPNGVLGRAYPCFEHQTIPDLLPNGITWRYYGTPDILGGNSQWIAPSSISHICQSTGPGGTCAGVEYTSNVDLVSADVLTDIQACRLRSISWVTPIGQNSDHAGSSANTGGPSWVASIVNAIGDATSCDGSAGYWSDTAIVITWDDWGGWYDHEPPTILTTIQGDYERGFRVPLIFVSAYTPAGTIVNKRLDFGSILRFVEASFGVLPGALTFDDERETHGLGAFFNLRLAPRPFEQVAAPLDAAYFINDKRPPEAPDDD